MEIESLRERGFTVEEEEIHEDDILKVEYGEKELEIKLLRLARARKEGGKGTFYPHTLSYPKEFQSLRELVLRCRGKVVKCPECDAELFTYDSFDGEFSCNGCGFLLSPLDAIKPDYAAHTPMQ